MSLSETPLAGLQLNLERGEAYPYDNPFASASLLVPIPGLNVIPVLPAGAVININGKYYTTRAPIQAGRSGSIYPLGSPRPSYIGPKKVGDTFVDRASVYWDVTLQVLTSTSGGGNIFIGYAVSNPKYGSATNASASTITILPASGATEGNATAYVASGTSSDGNVGGYAAADTYMEVEAVFATSVTNNNSAALSNAIADPGTGAAIPVTATASCQLVLAGIGETNTLAAPTFEGQSLLINAKTVATSATRIVTVAANFDGTNNTITFSAVAQFIKLIAVSSGSNFVWQLECYRGCALSHV